MKNHLTGLAIAATLLGSPAFAADMAMPVKAPPLAPPALGWTGCYLGVTAGGDWARSQWTSISTTVPAIVGLPVADQRMSGAALGGTAGCNYQVNAFVLGLEGDASWTNSLASGTALPPLGGLVETKQNWFGTVRGRIGYSVTERWLVYGTGGLAVTTARLRVFDNATFDVRDSQTRTGWALGAGTEVAIDRHWSAKFEYLHMDFGNANYFNPDVLVPGVAVIVAERNKLTEDLVRIGLNYALR